MFAGLFITKILAVTISFGLSELEKKRGMLFQTQKGTAHLPIFFPDLAKTLENPKTCPDFETHLEPCTNVSR